MELLMLALFGLVGILMHTIVKHKGVFIKREKLPWRVMIVNWVFSAIVVAILIGLKDDIEGFYPVTKVTILIAGYASDSIWRHFTQKTLAKMGVK